MTPNSETIEIIKHFEGCSLQAYADLMGVPTIGYGLTSEALDDVTVTLGMTISQREADTYLSKVLQTFGEAILPMMKIGPTPNQYGAMLSLAYNIGVSSFSKSTCLRRFNAGDIAGAAEALTWFNKAGGKVIRGLVRRREAEHTLFLSIDAEDTSPEPDTIKTVATSTTNWAAGVAGLSMAAGASDDVSKIIENIGVNPTYLFLGVGVCSLLWILKERLNKLKQGV
jgi:GH24 family phage-related lysozyme (muramidase)